MNILLLEDDNIFAEALIEEMRAIDPRIVPNVLHCTTSNDAISALKSDEFDYFIADRQVPIDQGGTQRTDHGDSVIIEFASENPGTPILILSAYNDKKITELIGEHAEKTFLWGAIERFSLIQYSVKDEIDKAVKKIKTVFDAFASMNDIELETEDDLNDWTKKALKAFSKAHGGTRATCKALTPGLSGSSVVTLTVYNSSNSPFIYAICKSGSRDKLKKEQVNFQRSVQFLPNEIYANLIDNASIFLGKKCAIFYNLLSEHNSCLFDLLNKNPESTPAVIDKIFDGLSSWKDASTSTHMRISEIRRLILSDEDFKTIISDFSLPGIERFEAMSCNLSLCNQHKDLHGENVLLTDNNEPKLIDFGDVGEAPSCFDALYLELSVFFHPSSSNLRGWADEKTVADWLNTKKYSKNTPFQPFIEACRSKAASKQPSKREFLGTAYSICIKQLKYPDTDKKIFVALINAIIAEALAYT